MQAGMKQAAVTAANVLEIAGSAAGVPYASAAGQILAQIIEACDSVRVNKTKAKKIKDKCVRFQNTLDEEQSKLEGTELMSTLDEALNSLDGIKSRMTKVARARSWEIWKSPSLEATLDKCEEDLESTQTRFTYPASLSCFSPASSRDSRTAARAQMSVVASQRDLHVKVDQTKAAVTHVHELVLELVEAGKLTLSRELEASLRAGEVDANTVHVQLMEAGQQGLRLVKQSRGASGLMIASQLTSSPSSSAAPSRGGSADASEVEKWQAALYDLHVETGVPPTIKVINGEVAKTSGEPVDGGMYSDIWEGLYLGKGKVALKALRNTKAEDPRVQERFRREVELWSTLKHDHILQFFGIVTDIGKHVHMVSPWQENGNIERYVKSHPHINRLGLMTGAASGLEYLHANRIVHGNVKCANILVTEKGEACITDFGMAKLVEEATGTSALQATLTQQEDGARWLAPELIEGTIKRPTFATDTYSFGMSILELVTGQRPYAEKKQYFHVVAAIAAGTLPRRPQEIRDDKVWDFLLRCWQHDVTLRPSMAEVKVGLEGLL